jgi:hypothetical protein
MGMLGQMPNVPPAFWLVPTPLHRWWDSVPLWRPEWDARTPYGDLDIAQVYTSASGLGSLMVPARADASNSKHRQLHTWQTDQVDTVHMRASRFAM